MAKAKLKVEKGSIYGFARHGSYISKCHVSSPKKMATKGMGIDAEVHIFGDQSKDFKEHESAILADLVDHWQKNIVANKSLDVVCLQTTRAPVWVVRPRKLDHGQKAKDKNHDGLFEVSSYSSMRDRIGGLWHSLKDLQGLKHLGVFFHNCNSDEIIGALVGIELASYRFTHMVKNSGFKYHFKTTMFGVSPKQLHDATSIGESVNLARHLVNLDAEKLNPASYAIYVKDWFADDAGVRVDIWSPERVKKENMNLHFGVGKGAVHGSHMVHIKYRPKGKHRLARPLAFVGKGVTFDTGGLDIKPASGMRLMKKDMGGSASIVGIANWVIAQKLDIACDFYLALAENAVDKNSFRPGDVLTARNGLTVEIHNTDAEGRLVMADVLDVATNVAPDAQPAAVIDLSTLTGAMRVAVGTEIAGMFSTHDGLATALLKSGAKAGDPAWRLPLWDNYKSQLRSSFADLSNASDSGFGGAISAALFLKRFVKGTIPWAHFDLYCWTDRSVGALGDVGGNGQGIQLMIEFLSNLKPELFK